MIEPRKIRENVYEIKPTETMRVPVKIFASEKILEQMQRDMSLQQASNVATLPGIVGESIVLSDAHQGYGSSIGAVAAFDMEEGIISPGMIGFDVNCLSRDSKVMLGHGMWRRIADIELDWENSRLHFLSSDKSLRQTNLDCFMKRKEDGFLYRITTCTGHIIDVTADHPVLTREGMKQAKGLGPDDVLVVHGFQGVEYEEPSDAVIVTEEDIEHVLDEIGIHNKGNARTQVMNSVRKLGMLPLRHDSPELPVLLKVLGFVFGDGCISFCRRKGAVSFYAKPEDLQDIKNDLLSIGINTRNIYSRKRNHSITTKYGTCEFSTTETSISNGSTGFCALLIALGCPYGNKTHQKYEIPAWILRAPLWQKRLFLAALFGAELSAPSTLNNYNFYDLQLNMSKRVDLLDSARTFLNQIRVLLREFGIATRKVVPVDGYSCNGKKGRTGGLRMLICGDPDNIARFFRMVSYEYNRGKHGKASLAVNYIGTKLAALEHRTHTRDIARSLYSDGTSVQFILSTLEAEHSSEQFTRHALWNDRGEPRVPLSFPSFETYCERHALGRDGFSTSKVADISCIPYSGWVYDVTMHDEHHNFIADGIVVSNCGVRLLATSLAKDDIEDRKEEIVDRLYEVCPVGVGVEGLRVTGEDLERVMVDGARWAVGNGYGNEEDLAHCEAGGRLPEADPKSVPQRAIHRGMKQLGTVGAGNHFVEVQIVDRVFSPVAETFGLREGQVVVMIHCGSRGFGHQICSDYIRMMEDAFPDIVKSLPDRNLIYAPITSDLARKYWGAMNAAANYAFCNRHILGQNVRKVFEELFPGCTVTTVYDVCHNIAKRETHEVSGTRRELLVHRKGATRAFPPGSEDLPAVYRAAGQPVLIPGSMGTASWVLVGGEGSMRETFGSTAHGAGRVMSRVRAKKDFPVNVVKAQLGRRGVLVKARSQKGISEEAPGAYKDVDDVVAVSHATGIARKVARLVPMGVVKG